VAVAVSLSVALGLSACENVATYTQPSLMRVIDASYIAPAISAVVEGQSLGANIGQGTITPYGTLAADIAAPINITAATGGATLVSTSGILLPGHQHSVFLTDNRAAPNGYPVTILEDQQNHAAGGHSAFDSSTKRQKPAPSTSAWCRRPRPWPIPFLLCPICP